MYLLYLISDSFVFSSLYLTWELYTDNVSDKGQQRIELGEEGDE